MNDNNSQATKEKSLIPLIIGVTGHKDLRSEDHGSLKEPIKEIFEELHASYKCTPLILLSPLAEGADRLVAEVALNMGVHLIVPLPMPQEEYEKDFQTQESKAEFLNLFYRADLRFEIPLNESNTLEKIREYGEARDRQYEQVGKYIAEKSQILIALWDGVETNLKGGTSEIIKYRLGDVPGEKGNEGILLNPVDHGPVYHIITPRRNSKDLIGAAFTRNPLYPNRWENNEKAEKAYQCLFSRIDTYNKDISHYSSRHPKKISQSKDWLIPQEKSLNLTSPLEETLNHYASSDALAIHFQKLTGRTMIAIFGIIPLAVLFFQLYMEAMPHPAILLLYLAALGLVYVKYHWAKRKDYQKKYLDYRALAEGLRVHFFWKLAGLHESAADHYLQKQRSELDWIRYALNNWVIGADNINAERIAQKGERQDFMALVKEQWVNDQAKYFKKKTSQNKEKMEKMEWRVKWIFLTGLIVATPLAILNPLFHYVGEIFQEILNIVVALCAIIAACISGYSEKMGFSPQARQYERMATLFGRASRILSKNPDNNLLAKEVIRDLGKAALEENGDWVLLHRERPLEIPKG